MFTQHRAGGGLRLVTSASDLTAASECEFAFLRRVDERLGRDVTVPKLDDPMLAYAAQLGDAHEERQLETYREQFGRGRAEPPGGVVEIERYSPSESHLREAAELTRRALLEGADVVFQATFFDDGEESDRGESHGDSPFTIGFVGYADFIVKTLSGAFEVQDTKLARRAKVTALLQLAAYAEQLERMGISVSETASLLLGDGSISEHRIADIAPVFRARRQRLHRILLDRAHATGGDGQFTSAPPIAWGAEGVAACGRCEVCEPEVKRVRDPLLIAGIRRTQRDRLIDAGFTTIDEVAALEPLLPGVSATASSGDAATGLVLPERIAPAVFARIVRQAASQVESEQRGSLAYRVVDASALAAIPAPNPGDLFFDFEGDPLYAETDGGRVKWGIDYLFGMVDTGETFTAIWAHSFEEERQALEQFITLVAERRKHHPDLKIYHYASYEKTHLLSIAARHGACEAEVDQLLREHVLVDLYPIAKQALVVGSPSYSIKKLEPLYMGDELRDESGVTSGAQSVTEYSEAMALLQSPLAEHQIEAKSKLEAIADYNRYDCVSTLRLRDWLQAIAREHGVSPLPVLAQQDASEEEARASSFEPSRVGAALAQHAGTAEREEDRRAAALGSSAIDYYQREQKSFWQAHFARLLDPIEEWADTRDVLVIDPALSEIESDWSRSGSQRIDRRMLRLRGEFAPGSTVRAGSTVTLLYAAPSPMQNPGTAPGSRGTRGAEVVDRHTDGLTVVETLPSETARYSVLPVAVTPGPPPRAGRQKTAIEAWGTEFSSALDHGHTPNDPVVDLLKRTPPRFATPTRAICDPASAEALDLAGGNEDHRTIGAVIATLRDLDQSFLAVQGPPGTGKTYLAAQVVKHLIKHSAWHIGVVAQSHKVVENLLQAVVDAGVPPEQVGKVPQGNKLHPEDPIPPWTVLKPNRQAVFVDALRENGQGSITGGTAWDLSNEDRFPRKSLDLLVIDEAGQFSLAPTIAASMAAHRLLLLGDPQQLPQVSQGSHPEPVDTSALSWLLGNHETMPEELGYFLAETRRMHPSLTEVVSELFYEGRLEAHPSTALRTVRGAGQPGLTWHPVTHEGNSTSSVEEAQRVAQIVESVIGATIEEPGHDIRALTEDDVIVIAAYNAQVECLAETLAAAGYGRIRVGTVDRFQGQEAVIAVVSTAASHQDDIPRGIEFLLMPNRLNVAISRAQWAAHLVSSDRLGEGLPSTAEGVATLSRYLRLTQ